jgi:hypothetical protein
LSRDSSISGPLISFTASRRQSPLRHAAVHRAVGTEHERGHDRSASSRRYYGCARGSGELSTRIGRITGSSSAWRWPVRSRECWPSLPHAVPVPDSGPRASPWPCSGPRGR